MTSRAAPQADALINGHFLALTAAHFLQAIGYASMILLPLYLDHLGASRAGIGAVMGAAAISGLIFRPLVGWSLDAWGRKPTLYVGTLIAASAMGLIYFVVDMGPLVYGIRLWFGIGQGAMFTGYFAFAADIVPESRRTEGLALFGVSGLIPLLVNPTADRAGVDPAALSWFLPLMGLIVLTSLLFLRAVPEPARHAPSTPGRLLGSLRVLARGALWPVWLATVVFSGLVALFFAFATVAASERGALHPADIWLSYAAGAAVVRLFGARLPDRLGPRNLVAPAVASYIGGALVIAQATTSADLLLAGLLAGIGHGYCFPVLASQVVSRVPADRRGSGMATFTALWALTGLLWPPLFGLVADARGDRVMFALAALLSVGLLAIWAVLEHRLGPEVSARTPAT